MSQHETNYKPIPINNPMLSDLLWLWDECLGVIDHKWGHSLHLTMGSKYDLAIAVGRKGGASSMHRHEHKSNTFQVVMGRIEIRTFADGDREIANAEMLTAGDVFNVPAGRVHRMVFLDSSVLYEFYVAEGNRHIDLQDITRIAPGWKPGDRDSDILEVGTP